jgi:two-component system LytT family response regulator
MEEKRLVRAYIVDDNESAIELLKRQLTDYSVEIVGTQTDSRTAMDEIIELDPDLLFLDVEMPGTSGLDFCTQVRQYVKPEMKVVFYTGYNKYLLDALRRQAFDYLLKPASKAELDKIMMRYYESRLSNMQQAVQNAIGEPPIVMIVNAMGEHKALRHSDIAFFRFQSDRRLWEVVQADGDSCMLRHKTTAEVILNYSKNFVQIHKRYIVNVSAIDKIQNNLCVLRPPLDNLDELHISKNYRHDLMNTFYNM